LVNCASLAFRCGKAAPDSFFYQLVNLTARDFLRHPDASRPFSRLSSSIPSAYKPKRQAKIRSKNTDGIQEPIEDGMTKINHDSDVAFIEALAELLNKSNLAELSVKREYGDHDSLNVKVTKYAPVAAPAAPAAPAPAAPAAPAAAAAAAPAAAPADPANHPGAVTSPMVGTAYLSPEPGADPFVSIGATVKEGQTVLIVEAMKTMNHIPAPKAGTVKRILVEDGSPVEYGAPLLIIE
jgi:acetyl-CoA carboxylase biotin carboxyl carrier protein